MYRLGLFTIVMLFAAAPVAHAANCPQTELSTAASQVQDARNVLLGLPVSAEPVLPKQAASAITGMKLKLAAFVLAYMQCQPENADVPGIAIDLARLGWAQDQAPPRGALFSGALVFAARAPQQGMIGITARFGIRCGSDTMLMLFEHSDEGWNEVLRAASPTYRDTAHAYQDFDYAVAPPDDDGNWFVVEKHAPAACSPGTGGLNYAVLRPTHDPTKPKVLFSGHDAGLKPDAALEVGSNSFMLGTVGDTPHRFAVTGQTVTPL